MVDEKLNEICGTQVIAKEGFQEWRPYLSWAFHEPTIVSILSKRLKSVFDDRIARRGYTIGLDYKTLREEVCDEGAGLSPQNSEFKRETVTSARPTLKASACRQAQLRSMAGPTGPFGASLVVRRPPGALASFTRHFGASAGLTGPPGALASFAGQPGASANFIKPPLATGNFVEQPEANESFTEPPGPTKRLTKPLETSAGSIEQEASAWPRLAQMAASSQEVNDFTKRIRNLSQR